MRGNFAIHDNGPFGVLVTDCRSSGGNLVGFRAVLSRECSKLVTIWVRPFENA